MDADRKINNERKKSLNKNGSKEDDRLLSQLAKACHPNGELTVVAVSHAETMNNIFPQWIRLCYRKSTEEYEPYDVNMPAVLIPRKSLHYRYDPPLTERGCIVAQTYGRGLSDAGIKPYEIFCSPEMKSIQTAFNIIKGLDTSYTSICIEPALLPFRQFFPKNFQDFLISPKTYFGLGYPINREYIPFGTIAQSESLEAYNSRFVDFFTGKISKIEQKHVVVISDNSMVKITENVIMESIDDILIANKAKSFQLNSFRVKGNEVKPIKNPIMPFSRCIYHRKPQNWQEVPHKLTVPNHPDCDRIK